MSEGQRRWPESSRPYMPGYGILSAEGGRGLLPWSWAEERLSKAHNYWLATTGPDARPHAMPVWGIWLEGAFYFSTDPSSRKARNLADNSNCVVCPEGADEAVVLEGSAEEVSDVSKLARFKETYKTKYDWDMDTSQGGIYAVHPRVAFGLIENAAEFAGAATRWRFD